MHDENIDYGIPNILIRISHEDTNLEDLFVETDNNGKWTERVCDGEYKITVETSSVPSDFKLTSQNAVRLTFEDEQMDREIVFMFNGKAPASFYAFTDDTSEHESGINFALVFAVLVSVSSVIIFILFYLRKSRDEDEHGFSEFNQVGELNYSTEQTLP